VLKLRAVNDFFNVMCLKLVLNSHFSGLFMSFFLNQAPGLMCTSLQRATYSWRSDNFSAGLEDDLEDDSIDRTAEMENEVCCGCVGFFPSLWIVHRCAICNSVLRHCGFGYVM